MSKLEITPEKVREAAAKCSTAAATLKVLFPEAFEDKDAPFEFGDSIKLVAGYAGNPFMIGVGIAPAGLEHKCLVMAPDYEMRSMLHNSRTILTFHKKP
jgi:hypothetical protein